MKEYKKPQYAVLEKRLHERRKFIQVITGPRQVGKTTLIHQVLKGSGVRYTYISGDKAEGSGRSWIEKHWESARFISRKDVSEHILAIDEIQKIPDWSRTVKALWDEDSFKKSGIKVILSGSSGLLLQQGLAESLEGRFELTPMTHWTFSEMHEAFGWTAEKYAWFGGYPGSASLIRNEGRWKGYVRDSLVEPTIAKDILMMTRIDKPALLRQLFDLGCSFSGQILSYNKMLGQLQDAGNTTTLAGYLNLLDRAGLITGLEKYSGSVVRQKLSSPKLVVRNTALLSSARHEKLTDLLIKPEIWGRVVESAVGAHLVNSCEHTGIKVNYWRDANDEVDFVLSDGKKTIALEIKSGASTRKSGIDRFMKAYPSAKALIIGDSGIPWQEILARDPTELF